jgi:uncharacterized protein
VTLPRLTLEALTERLAEVGEQRRPPVEKWNPSHRGVIDITIARDGRWFHEGGEIKRPALVALFASILRCDEEGHWLVTPAEKLRITVEDTPFLAVDVELAGEGAKQQLMLKTNVGDWVPVDATHPLVARDEAAGGGVVLSVRGQLWARLDRPTYYHLASLADSEPPFAVISGGLRFPLIPGAAPEAL